MTFPEFHAWWIARGRHWAALLALAACAVVEVRFAEASAGPMRLIMVEEYGCRFCHRWNAEVGTVYARSEEGRKAPLVRVKREAADVSRLKPVVYTPTFILMQDDREVGRISGYPGESYFWEELDALIALAEKAQNGHSSEARN
jgi:hypothetical protein